MVEAHVNCIGGERRPAQSGAVFEVTAPTIRCEDRPGPDYRPGTADRFGTADRSQAEGRREGRSSGRAGVRPGSLGTWPRSGVADVRAAILAARAAAGAWAALALARRREILERAARELGLAPDPGGLLAARLGLAADEIAPHLLSVPESLDRALRDPMAAFGSRRIAEEGLLLFAPAWSELVSPAAAALFSALLLGRTVLVVSDPHAPMLAEAVVAALERAGLPGGVLSLVHDDGEDALRAAFGSGAASYTRASGYPSRVRRFERLASGSVRDDFGAGVDPSLAPAVDLRILRSRSTVVRSSEDPAVRAAEIAERSFGRSRSLSGQLPGQIARAVCEERIFSRFTEALLSELRRSHDVRHPVPLVERESEEDLRRLRVLGLDEGATLIFDGEDVQAHHADPAAGEDADPRTIDPDTAPRSPAAAFDAILSPTVFTNVEERMRLSLLGRPVPLLCLLRVAADEQAEALAERLDRDVPAEDLALDASE